MKKKYIVWLIVFALLAFCSYKVYKIWFYSLDNLKDKEFLEVIDKQKVETVNITSNLLEDREYTAFQNIKIRNDFDDMESSLVEDPNSVYISFKLRENDQLKYMFQYGETFNYVDSLSADKLIFGDNDNRSASLISKKYLNKHKIVTERNLIDYLRKNIDSKHGLFTSKSDLKERYTLFSLSSTMMTMSDDITLIDGDLSGYMMNFDTYRELRIEKDKRIYFFSFYGEDRFDKAYVLDFLKYIAIE